MKLWAVEHFFLSLLGGCNSKPTQKWWWICSTAQSFIRKEVSSYKIHTLVLYMSFDKFILAVESRDLSQADKSIIRVYYFPKLSDG